MKTFIITSTSNYGLCVQIVNFENIEKAKEFAREYEGCWEAFKVVEIKKENRGLIFEEYS